MESTCVRKISVSEGFTDLSLCVTVLDHNKITGLGENKRGIYNTYFNLYNKQKYIFYYIYKSFV